MSRRAALAAALACALAGCSASSPGPVLDPGAVRDGVYHNDYFRLSLPIPFGWTVEKNPRGDWFLDNYLNLLAAGDQEMTDPKTLPKRKHVLLRAFSNQTFIEIGASEVGLQPKLNLGSDCLKRVPAILDAGGRPYRITKPVHPALIGGLKFDGMAFTTTLADGEMHEHVYAIVRWGYALVFVAGAPNPAGLGKAEAVLARAVYTPAP